MNGQQNKSFGPTLNFGWSDELPPTFKGSTTSLSQSPFPHHAVDNKGNNLGFLSSGDVLAAASAVYSNSGTHEDVASFLNHQPHAASAGQSRASGHHNHSAPKEPASRVPVGFHTSEMLFDVHQPVPVEQQPKRMHTLQWGSDASFMNQSQNHGYEPPTKADETQRLLDYMTCLEPQPSAPNTRPSSPPNARSAPWPVSNGTIKNSDHSQTEDEGSKDEDASPRKRRRVSVKREEDEDEDASSLRPKRKTKSSNKVKPRQGSTDASSRKSRQQQNSAKAAKENLTEEQKRTNHILSEQKRRNLIRQGFDELCALVPGLRGGGFSKSAMLTQSADWLEEVLHGNAILRKQLAELKTMNGMIMPR